MDGPTPATVKRGPQPIDPLIRHKWLARYGGAPLIVAEGPRLELFRVNGETAPVGFIESGKMFAHWTLEIKSICSEPPPGASEAPWLLRRATYGMYERLDPAQAEEWAEGILAEESRDDHGPWQRARPKGTRRTKTGEGAICSLAPAPGWPPMSRRPCSGS